MESISLKEKYKFNLKFKSYNPEDFQRIEEILPRLFARDSQELTPEGVHTRSTLLEESSEMAEIARREDMYLKAVPLASHKIFDYNIKLKGPIPLPRKKKLFTVNRSHHVHKKSQEQFILTTYKRVWVLELVKNIRTFLPDGGASPSSTTFKTIYLPKVNNAAKPAKLTGRPIQIPWCLEESSLWNIIKGVRLALEPLEEIPGLSIHWKGTRSLTRVFPLN